jgi:hypothetical protein
MCWISEQDEGQADAISKGFSLCKGDILSWLNSDDIYVTRSAVSLIVNLFESYHHADTITGSGVYLTEEGHWVQPIEFHQEKICYQHIHYGCSILQPATFFRRHVFEKVPLDRSLVYAFDWDFFIRVTRQFNVLPVNCIIAGFRMYGRNKTAAGGARRVKEIVEFVGRYLGKGSWQYYGAFLYYVLYLISGLFPGRLRVSLFRLLKLISTGMSRRL